MANPTPSFQRLQAIADDFYRPGYSVKVVTPTSRTDIIEAAVLLEQVWTVGEPLSAAILSDPEYQERGIKERFHQFCLDCCQFSSESSLLLAVVSKESGKMVSLLVGMPCTPDVYPHLTNGQGEKDLMAPWLDILHQLDGPLDKAVDKLDDVSKVSIKLLDFFGYATSKLYEGRHLTHLTRDAMFRIGIELGYTNAIGKFSSSWQKAIHSRWGWEYLGEAVYHEYEWEDGHKPFQTIPIPDAVQLAWIDLASTQVVKEPIGTMAPDSNGHQVDLSHSNGTNGDGTMMNGRSKAPKQLALLPVLQEFKEYIEADRRLFLYFNQMWVQSNKARSFPGHVTIKGYNHMFEVLNDTLQSTPTWTAEVHHVGSAGLPICDMFYYAVATPSGYAAFTDPGVTRMMKRLLNFWGEYLSTPESADALGSWMSESGGRDVLCAVANTARETDLTFEELFECDPTQPNYGYKSWDEFFIRRYRDGVRPIASPDDENIIANACESKSYNLAHNVKYQDRFWIKGNAYSLWDMLKRDDLPWAFVGGTVYQAFLSPYSYHRWHAPVSGVVRYAYALEGTYFTIPEFHDIDSRAHREDEDINVEEWQAWLACQATRGIIIIEADNPALGLVGFVAIGMVEVSTIDIGVSVGQRVNKGDELGCFHFGGSSHCLLFQRGVDVCDFPQGPPERPQNFPVNGPVARLRTAAN